MPVFHTKTIESILEPVAQQVSRLVILHEEAEDGNAMPDLAQPTIIVQTAVQNLVKVGYDTINSSEDAILKQDMPPALKRVEESSLFLVEASRLLRDDPYSGPARRKLIDGSRGILQGTSSLLLAFDESEVRKIIRQCKNVMEYLAITEVIENMQDLVTYVKNLSPGLTRMTKEVDNREKELTHQVHRDMLTRSLEQVKVLTPILISSMKIFITARHSGGGLSEAQDNRNYTVCKMADEIREMIRVLQLTTYDEDEWDADDLTVMKKAQGSLEDKLKAATDWLLDPSALVGSLGDKALRQIIDDARKIADRCVDPADRERILGCTSQIESMADALSELRQQGKGDTPQAMSLAKGIQQKLKELTQLTAQGITGTERSGIRKPAPTVDGKVEQARQWMANPDMDDKGLGEEATRMIVSEGRKVANCCQGAARQELLRLCDETEILTNQLADLCKKGQGSSPQARAIARNLSDKLGQLQSRIKEALVSQVADDFNDTSTPLKQLSAAAVAPLDMPNRVDNFESKAQNFASHAHRLADTANSVATAGGCPNKQTVEAIFKNSSQINDLTPQVVNAARVLFSNPNNQAAMEHFDLVKKQWTDNMDRLRSLVDEAVDSSALISAEEAGIIRDTERVEEGIRAQDSQQIASGASSIARRANRVMEVADHEAQNSEDPAFVDRVSRAAEMLSSTLNPTTEAGRTLAMSPGDPSAAGGWRGHNQQLIQGVQGVKEAVKMYDDRANFPPPPPDMSQLHISVPDSSFGANSPSMNPDGAPPRPPLPMGDGAPPRPPPPETDDEEEFPTPQANQPIMMAAHSLHMEAKQWSSKDNEIIAAAKKMALLMAKLSQLVRGETDTRNIKKDLIATAKAIAEASEEVTKLAMKLAAECTDKKMRMNLLNVCERIPTIGTQLKILSTVKATMLGAQESSSEEDIEATEMLVGNAQNLMQAVKETVRTAEAASIKIRVDSGYTIRWARKRPWYT